MARETLRREETAHALSRPDVPLSAFGDSMGLCQSDDTKKEAQQVHPTNMEQQVDHPTILSKLQNIFMDMKASEPRVTQSGVHLTLLIICASVQDDFMRDEVMAVVSLASCGLDR